MCENDKNEVCNVFGVSSNCSINSCECKIGYNGTRCEQCEPGWFVWSGQDGKMTDGHGVECGKYKVHC